MIVALNNVTKYYGADLVLSDITCAINPGDRIGLIGPNGAGKTTLLALISGELESDSGEFTRIPHLRVGYFHQSAAQELSGTIDDELRVPFKALIDMKSRLDKTAELMAKTDPSSEEGAKLAAEYDKLNTAYESGGGYLIEVRINTVVEGMGFSSFDRGMETSLLSGGERTRLGLAKLLLVEPDLLILDEVTNHLDFRMLAFLEDWLSRYKGAVLTVSHDRYFLEKSTNKTWEIEDKRLVTYPASYDGYLLLKEQREALIQKEYDRYIEEKERLEDYVRRNIVRATTSDMAKSRIKMLERLEEKPPVAPKKKPPKFRFTFSGDPVKDVLSVSGLSMSVGEGDSRKKLFEDINFKVTRGEKIAVIGENGVGKSTLFKALAEALRPTAGSIEWGRGTRVSYFEQDDASLGGRGTVLDYLWDIYPSQDQNSLRTLLGGVGITGENVYKSVGVLSGGEKAKVKIASMLLKQGNILLMDEPTNHLDIPAKERLESAIRNYEGTVLAISHDRRFLTSVPSRIIEITGSGARFYSGNFSEYLSAKESASESETNTEVSQKEKKPNAYHRTKKQRGAQQAVKTRIAQCEERISAGERRIAEIEAILGDEATASDYEKLMSLTEEMNKIQGENDELLSLWEELHDELESI